MASSVNDDLPDRIADMFADGTLFLTGGTGFLGKVLVEKLLRSCPKIKKIYLLVRPKKGKDPKQRLEEMFTSPLFDMLKASRGGVAKVMQHVDIISGDVTEPDLGISEEDRSMLQRDVDFIYHSAATIRFDEELRKAVMLNTRGTKLVLELARGCKKLKLFCHVSTSYCHLHEKLLEEKPYPPPANPHNIIKCMEWMDDATVNSMEAKILDTLPNTYAFTKSLSEGLVVEQMGTVPVLIVRPSIVVPIWKEPLPGWTDNVNGPVGLLIGAGKGVLRTMYCHSNGYADYLPVDITVNGMLVASWNYVSNGQTEKSIYNITSSAEVKVSWQELIDTGRKIVMEKVPLNGVVWYPGGSMKNSRLIHRMCVFFFHFLPAVFVDTLLFLTGNKPILMRVQRRINKGFEVFEYYANNQWDFKSDNIQECRPILNDRERIIYKIDANGLDISGYFENCIRAARLYILKEPEDTLPAARRHMNVMWWVDRLTKLCFFGFLIWCFTDFFSTFFNYFLQTETKASTTFTPTRTALPIKEI